MMENVKEILHQKEKKQNKPLQLMKSTLKHELLHHLGSSSQLGIALPSVVPQKAFFYSGVCYWSHLSSRIAHHLQVS